MQLSRLLEAHEIVLKEVREAAKKAAEAGDDGTNDLLVSGAAVGAIRSEGAGEAALASLADLGPQTLRGREGAIGLWGLKPDV